MRIRILWTLLILAVPILAQDADEMLKKAKALDAKAEALLDQGRRAEAFELLAQAADLRAQARSATRGKAKAHGTEPQAQPKKAEKAKKAKKPKPKAKKAPMHAALDAALEKGDMEGARAAAVQVRRHLLRWTKQLDAREKRLATRGPESVEARVAALERQVKELRRLLERPAR